ncbi:zinc finger MYM-type protein 1-like [Bolinopsis microptera]|uniref:zinc finger MYM-type protein 1-like n=1 Tax=Bolinopsis microptera TaxID=2820187 RepID=UPI0030792B03
MNTVGALKRRPFATLTVDEKRAVVKLGPHKPVVTIQYQTKAGNVQNQKHNPTVNPMDNFLSAREWLTVDVEDKRLYCFPCLLFAKKRDTCWVETGFHRISYIGSSMEKHDQAREHRSAVIDLKLFLRRTNHFEVGSLISMNSDEIERHNNLVCRNREIVKRLINAVIYLAKQEMAFRGHDESETSVNRGPFKELLSMVAKTDSLLFDHLDSSTVFKGDSKTIQNEIIALIATMTRELIKEEVKSADFFAVIADETTDVSTTNQLTTILRYVHNGQLKERFLGFDNVSEVSGAEGLAGFILNILKEFDPESKLVAQTYDGASTMSGRTSGVQARIREVIKRAIFIHCMAHKLNLALQDATKAISKCVIFFATLSGINAFFGVSYKRTAQFHKSCHLHQTTELAGGKRKPQAASSATRWAYKSRTKVGLDLGWSSSTVEEAVTQLKHLEDNKFADIYDCKVDANPPETQLKFCKLLNSESFTNFSKKDKFPDGILADLENSVYGSLFNTAALKDQLGYLYNSNMPGKLSDLAKMLYECDLKNDLPQVYRLTNLALTVPLTLMWTTCVVRNKLTVSATTSGTVVEDFG